jgi:amidase
VLTRIGALPSDVKFPSLDAVVRDAVPLCGVKAAVAHEATYPSRAVEYGPVFTGLLETGHALDGHAVAKILLRREAFRGQLNTLFRDIDVLIMPVMNWAAPSLAAQAAAGRTPAAVEARIRFTAPFDMSERPTLTLPGCKAADGLPVGFQIVGRHMQEAMVLRAGHAFQEVTDWLMRRPPSIRVGAC